MKRLTRVAAATALLTALAGSATAAAQTHKSPRPVGPLPKAPVTSVVTQPGSLVAVALPRSAASTGLVWRLARDVNASIVRQVAEADVGSTVVVIFQARHAGRAEIVFALTRGEASPKALRAARYVVLVRRAPS